MSVALPYLGLAFYALLGVLELRHKPRIVALGLFIAAGIHFALFACLLAYKAPCIPCLATGFGAVTGAAVVFWSERDRMLKNAATLLAAFAISSTCVVFDAVRQDSLRQIEIQKASALVFNSPGGARTRVVYFSRDGCDHCTRFKREIAAPLVAEFSASVDFEERGAWDGLPTPIVFVSGKRMMMFTDLPPLDAVRGAILRALGRE